MTTPPVPTDLSGVTPDWLTAALSHAFPGTVVTQVTCGPSVQAFATNVRLLLGYADAGHAHKLPATMYLKTDFSPAGGSAPVAAAAAREVRYYRQVADAVPVRQPRCFFAWTDVEGRSVLLLEDLLARNARMGSPTAPLDPDSAATGLEQLAALHAHWWSAPELARLETLPGSLKPVVLERLLGDDAWSEFLTRPSGHHVPQALRTASRMRQAQVAMWELADQAAPCLIHGDPHLGNTFLDPDHTVGFLDWQAASRGSWAYDVTRFIVSSLSIDSRREHDRDLLAVYLDALERRGVQAPTSSDAWLAYRRSILNGLRFLCSGYSDEVIEAYVSRFAAAADDVDALASLA